MCVRLKLIVLVGMLLVAMPPALSKSAIERAREGVFAGAFLNIAAIAEPQGDTFYALVAPSTVASITAQRPLQLAKFSLSGASELNIALVPLSIETDGDSWRRHPLLTVEGQNAVVAYDDKAGKTHVSRVNLASGATKPLPLEWLGAPVALFVRGEDVLVVTTTGVYLGSQPQALLPTSACSPFRATKVAVDTYTLFCGTAGREIRVQRMVLAPSGRDEGVAANISLLGSVDGILVNSEASGTSASIVISDPETKQFRIANVGSTGRITYTPFETTLDPSAKMAIVSTGDVPLRAVAARRDEVKVFSTAADRPAVRDLSFKDTHHRVTHVRGVRAMDLGGKPYLIVETHLVALRGLDLPDGVNNASRISLIPMD
jgi:hypothetical protein